MPQRPPLDERGLSLPAYDGGTKPSSSATTPTAYGATDDEASEPPPTVEAMTETKNGGGGGTGTATLASCAINLANTIVGAGMLGLPGAFGGTGYVGGPLLLVSGAAFSAHGLMLLAEAAADVGVYPSSFYVVARAAVPRYTVLIDLAVALKCFGVATGYLITVADCMIDAVDHVLLPRGEGGGADDAPTPTAWATRVLLSRQFWVAAAAAGVLPIAFYRSFDKLKTSSAAALGFVFVLAAGIVAYAHGWAGDPCEGYVENDHGGLPCRGEVVPFTDGPTTLSKLPIFIFAFTCQQNVFPIVNEIQRRSLSRIGTVVTISIGFALGIFFVVALNGYLTFGDRVRGDILLNYPEDGKVTVMRVCIAVMLMLHYPLQLDPSRRCIMSLWRVVRGWIRDRRRRRGGFFSYAGSVEMETECQPPSHEQEQEQWHDAYTEISVMKASSSPPPRREYDGAEESWTDDDPAAIIPSTTGSNTTVTGSEDDGEEESLFLGVTFAFLLCSFGVALTVDDLGVVLALVGATGSTLVSYVLPGLIYVKVTARRGERRSAKRIMAYVQLILGCLIIPVALYFVINGERGE